MANIILPFGASGGHQIGKSLRARGASNPGMYRSVGTTTNRRTYTLSRWFKLGTLDQGFLLWQGYANASNWTSFLVHASSRQFSFAQADGGVGNWAVVSTAAFRDPGAWYHVVIQVDTTDATSANRVRAWMNGVVVPLSASGAGFPSLNKDTHINVSGAQQGFGYEATNYLQPTDGHHAEIHFVDGQLVAPSAFGRIDPTTGAWVPVVYAGTHGGVNGAVHDFRDAASIATLGYDYSGNGAHLTASGFSVTAGVTFDQSPDTPTNNYATHNPLKVVGGSIGEGLSAFAATGGGVNFGTTVATQALTFPAYWETVIGSSITYCNPGIIQGKHALTTSGNATVGHTTYADSVGYYASNGDVYVNNAAVVAGATPSSGDVIQHAFDPASGKYWIGRNGTWLNSGDPVAGTGQVATVSTSEVWFPAISEASSQTVRFNFGQRGFAYTPPSGFKALNTKNIPVPLIKRPSDYMRVVLDTGANIKTAAEAVLAADFLELIKDRANSNNWQAIDTVRGTSAVLQTNTTATETTYSAPSGSSAGFVWKRGATPGFDIVTYTGNATAGRTVGHALGALPHLAIIKARSVATNWYIYHRGLTSAAYQVYLNLTNAQDNAVTTAFNNKAPTASVFELPGTGLGSNNNGETYIAYLWTEIPGFSRIGAYTGNGAADGPFVWCGFRPRFLLIKSHTSATSWMIYDGARNPANPADLRLAPNVTNAEASSGAVDFVANGFKLRANDANTNGGATGYVYAAFAEAPFKYANAR